MSSLWLAKGADRPDRRYRRRSPHPDAPRSCHESPAAPPALEATGPAGARRVRHGLRARGPAVRLQLIAPAPGLLDAATAWRRRSSAPRSAGCGAAHPTGIACSTTGGRWEHAPAHVDPRAVEVKMSKYKRKPPQGSPTEK